MKTRNIILIGFIVLVVLVVLSLIIASLIMESSNKAEGQTQELTCSGFNCDGQPMQNNPSAQCENNPCTVEDCCTVSRTPPTGVTTCLDFDCSGISGFESNQTVECSNDPCTVQECCTIETETVTCLEFECPDDMIKITDSSQNCSTNPCTVQECCTQRETQQSTNQLCSNQPDTFCDSSPLDLNQNIVCPTSCTTDICCSDISDDINNYSENICENIDCPQRTDDSQREHCPNAGNIFNLIINRNYINNFVINRININGDTISNFICDPETNINFGALFSFNLFRIPYLYRTGTIDSQDNLISGYPLNYIFVGNNQIFSEFFSTTHNLMDITIDNIFNEEVLQSRRSGIFVKQLQFNLKTNNIVSTNLFFGYIKLTVSNNQPLTILLTIQNGRVYLNELNDSHNYLINNIQENELIP